MPTGPTNTLFWNRFQYIFTIWNLSHKSKGNFSRSQNIDAPKKTSNCRGDRLLLPKAVNLWNAGMYTLWVGGNWVLLSAVRTYGGLCFRAIFTPRFIPLCVYKELQPQKTQKALHHHLDHLNNLKQGGQIMITRLAQYYIKRLILVDPSNSLLTGSFLYLSNRLPFEHLLLHLLTPLLTLTLMRRQKQPINPQM